MSITNIAIRTATRVSTTRSCGDTFSGRTTVNDKVISGAKIDATDFTKYIPGVRLTGFNLNGEALVFNRRATEAYGNSGEDVNGTVTKLNAVNSRVINIHLGRPVEPFSTGSSDIGWNLFESVTPVAFTRAARGIKKETEVAESDFGPWHCECANCFDELGESDLQHERAADSGNKAGSSIQKDIVIIIK